MQVHFFSSEKWLLYTEVFYRRGFAIVIDKSIKESQHVLCNKIPSVESLIRIKYKYHFHKIHEFLKKIF